MADILTPDSAAPQIERVRHEIRRRTLEVKATTYITPRMLRLTLAGDLADFTSLGADDHIKLFVAGPNGEAEKRDYTPRRFDDRSLAIDFAVHDGGPVTQWALGAKVGDTLEIAGPRGSAIYGHSIPSWLLIGDETALPAIGRRIEEARAGTRIRAVVAIVGAEERQTFETEAAVDLRWAYRPACDVSKPGALIKALQDVEFEPGTFVWIAAEASVAKAVRAYVTEIRGHPLSWIKAAGYWTVGKADSSEKL